MGNILNRGVLEMGDKIIYHGIRLRSDLLPFHHGYKIQLFYVLEGSVYTALVYSADRRRLFGVQHELTLDDLLASASRKLEAYMSKSVEIDETK